MKSRALNILSSALIVLSAFFFVAGLCLAEEENLYVTQPVTITVVLGKVEVLTKDALIWEEAKEGVELFEGDKIKTDIDGKAQLTLKDGSYIKLKEETTLGIKTAREETVSQASQYELDFRVGEIMVELKKLKKGSSFEVETPTAVAAARGSIWYMRTGTKIVDGVEKSYVEIYGDSDDLFLFTSTITGESCIVRQGQSAIIFGDGAVEGPFDIPPAAQDTWKSGFDMYDDSHGSKGMRDRDVDEDEEEEEGGEEEDTGDASGDIDDTTASQDDAQDDANQDQSGEQDITGLAKVDILPDADADGVPDIEDAFPNDSTIHSDTTFNDIDGNPVTVKGYGSRDELRQAGIDNLLDIQGLKQDIYDLIDDIQARQFEAVKESIFDHQAGKVMTDYWGNRVRVEEYISRPTNEQVRILALNLRTAGPNAGISSMDFRTTFNQDISTRDLKSLPWGDYMSVYERGELDNGIVDLRLNGVYEKGYNGYYDYDDILLIGYETDPEKAGYPLPVEFYVEVKNPYGDSLRVIESYSTNIGYGTIGDMELWYQTQSGELGNRTFLNEKEYFSANYLAPEWTEYWGYGWNDENRHTFFDYYLDVETKEPAWLVGVFFLINDNGGLVTGVNDDYLDNQRELDIVSVRNCINPEYNMEMVFFSSEFGDTSFEDLEAMDLRSLPDYADELNLYTTYRNIDVITIPEITTPYYTPSP